MEFSQIDFLNWVRGPGMMIALSIFIFGVALRLFEVLAIGRPRDLSEARPKNGSGWRTILTRSWPGTDNFKRDTATYISGYVFHLAFFITLLFFAPHIELFRNVVGFSWPSLPTPLVDAVAVLGILSMIFVLALRLLDPVRRFLSNWVDYLVWTVTFLPLLTGYMAFHHLWVPYKLMLALHILSVEILLVVFPFTKLTHAFTLFISRWYNGEAFARKGVQS